MPIRRLLQAPSLTLKLNPFDTPSYDNQGSRHFDK